MMGFFFFLTTHQLGFDSVQRPASCPNLGAFAIDHTYTYVLPAGSPTKQLNKARREILFSEKADGSLASGDRRTYSEDGFYSGWKLKTVRKV